MLHTTHDLQVRSRRFAAWSFTKGTSEAVLLPVCMLYLVKVMWTMALHWFSGRTSVEMHPSTVHLLIICSYYAGQSLCGMQLCTAPLNCPGQAWIFHSLHNLPACLPAGSVQMLTSVNPKLKGALDLLHGERM
jgi:hypothetical protein